MSDPKPLTCPGCHSPLPMEAGQTSTHACGQDDPSIPEGTLWQLTAIKTDGLITYALALPDPGAVTPGEISDQLIAYAFKLPDIAADENPVVLPRTYHPERHD